MKIREFRTYAGWKRAVLKIDPQAFLDGDSEICCALTSDRSQGIGEWDGAFGTIDYTLSDD